VNPWAFVLLLMGGIAPLWGQTKKPSFAVFGPDGAVNEFVARVLPAESGPVKTFVHQAFPREGLAGFQAVIFTERDELAISSSGGWTPDQWKEAENYVQKGGRILFCRYGISTVSPKRELETGSLLTGIQRYPDLKGTTTLRWTTEGKAWGGALATREPDPGWLGINNPFAVPLPQAQVLMEGTDSKGAPLAFLIRQATGSGEVYFLGSSLQALKRAKAPESSASALIELIRKILALPAA